MLRIRKDQVVVLGLVADEGFQDNLIAFLHTHHSQCVVRLPAGDQIVAQIAHLTLRTMVQNGLTIARAYNITWETSMASFVVLMFLVAPNFHDHPLIRPALIEVDTDPNVRIDCISERLTETDWQAVRKAYCVASWKLNAPEV